MNLEYLTPVEIHNQSDFSQYSDLNHWAGNLEDHVDKKVTVLLRDGRLMVGMLRSFDHFGNIMMENVFDRRVVESNYADIFLGVVVIRGENIVLFGEVDENLRSHLREVDLGQILYEEESRRISERSRAAPHVDLAFLDD